MKEVIKSISLLGTGWLGMPLGESLLKKGFTVKGSTTRPEKLTLLRQKGLSPFLINLEPGTQPGDLAGFLASDLLVINFPPGIRKGHGPLYLQQLDILAAAIDFSPIKYILFISSTAVYPDNGNTWAETDDLSPYAMENIYLAAENKITGLAGKIATILRFGGLVGGDRHPGRFLAGKTGVINPWGAVNLLHLDDCLGVIGQVIENNAWDQVYNVCADEHPSRQEFYTAAALKLGLTPPEFLPPSTADSGKIISNRKLKSELPYNFLYPDPLAFLTPNLPKPKIE